MKTCKLTFFFYGRKDRTFDSFCCLIRTVEIQWNKFHWIKHRKKDHKNICGRFFKISNEILLLFSFTSKTLIFLFFFRGKIKFSCFGFLLNPFWENFFHFFCLLLAIIFYHYRRSSNKKEEILVLLMMITGLKNECNFFSGNLLSSVEPRRISIHSFNRQNTHTHTHRHKHWISVYPDLTLTSFISTLFLYCLFIELIKLS